MIELIGWKFLRKILRTFSMPNCFSDPNSKTFESIFQWIKCEDDSYVIAWTWMTQKMIHQLFTNLRSIMHGCFRFIKLCILLRTYLCAIIVQFRNQMCYVAISVFHHSRPGQRINSLHVIETGAAYRNPRFRSIPSGRLPRMGLEKENLFASETIN